VPAPHNPCVLDEENASATQCRLAVHLDGGKAGVFFDVRGNPSLHTNFCPYPGRPAALIAATGAVTHYATGPGGVYEAGAIRPHIKPNCTSFSQELNQVSTGRKLGRKKGGKNSRPTKKPAQLAKAVIEKVTESSFELNLSIREVIELAFRAAGMRPETLLADFIIKKDVRVCLWTLEQYYGKPKQLLEATGAAGAPMEMKVIIERIGGPQNE
jgi:hypothetical protein